MPAGCLQTVNASEVACWSPSEGLCASPVHCAAAGWRDVERVPPRLNLSLWAWRGRRAMNPSRNDWEADDDELAEEGV